MENKKCSKPPTSHSCCTSCTRAASTVTWFIIGSEFTGARVKESSWYTYCNDNTHIHIHVIWPMFQLYLRLSENMVPLNPSFSFQLYLLSHHFPHFSWPFRRYTLLSDRPTMAFWKKNMATSRGSHSSTDATDRGLCSSTFFSSLSWASCGLHSMTPGPWSRGHNEFIPGGVVSNIRKGPKGWIEIEHVPKWLEIGIEQDFID